MIVNLNQDNFQEFIQSNSPVLVDFWATWCPPCMKQGEILHAINQDNAAFKIGKVNVDDYRDLAVKFGIANIPTMILFQNGEILETIVGLRNASQVLELFKKYGAYET